MEFTLSEILSSGADWDKFCGIHGISVYSVNEGFGDSKIELSKDEMIEIGILNI